MTEVEFKQKNVISCDLEDKQYSLTIPDNAAVGQIIDFCLGLADHFLEIQIQRTKEVAELKEKEIESKKEESKEKK